MSRELISNAAASFLNLRRFPACLDVDQVAVILGRHRDHIPLLVQGKFLEPLGDPPPNGVKLFAAKIILEKADDPKWLDRAAKYLTRHWQSRNTKHPERGITHAAPVPEAEAA